MVVGGEIKPSEPTLYENHIPSIGGRNGIHSLADDLLDRVLNEEAVQQDRL